MFWCGLSPVWFTKVSHDHSESVPYPSMHHFVTEMCTHVHISVTTWCIEGYGTDALWHLCNRSMASTQSYDCPNASRSTMKNMSNRITRIYWEITMWWWRHQMETFSVLLALCVGNSPVTGEFPSHRPVTRSFDVFFVLRLNNQLSKHSRGWWVEMQSRPLWRHCNVITIPKTCAYVIGHIPCVCSDYNSKHSWPLLTLNVSPFFWYIMSHVL